MSISYPGIVRAWHKHERGQVDCFLAARGVLRICAYDDKSKELKSPDEVHRPWDDQTISEVLNLRRFAVIQ